MAGAISAGCALTHELNSTLAQLVTHISPALQVSRQSVTAFAAQSRGFAEAAVATEDLNFDELAKNVGIIAASQNRRCSLLCIMQGTAPSCVAVMMHTPGTVLLAIPRSSASICNYMLLQHVVWPPQHSVTGCNVNGANLPHMRILIQRQLFQSGVKWRSGIRVLRC